MDNIPKSGPILWVMAILFGADILLAGIAHLLPDAAVSIYAAVTAALTGLFTFYLRNRHVESRDVAVADPSGRTPGSSPTPIAGQASAANIPTGSTLGLSETLREVLPPPPKAPHEV
jgi:hypothetical protein